MKLRFLRGVVEHCIDVEVNGSKQKEAQSLHYRIFNERYISNRFFNSLTPSF